MVCVYKIINANLRKLISFLQLTICDEAFEIKNICKNPTLTKIAKNEKNGLEISKEIFLNYFNVP